MYIFFYIMYIYFISVTDTCLLPAKKNKEKNPIETVVALVVPWTTKEVGPVEPVPVVECPFSACTPLLVVCWTTRGQKVTALNLINCLVTPQMRQQLANMLFRTCILSCCLCYQFVSLSYKPNGKKKKKSTSGL